MKLPIISLILPRGIYITFPPPGGGKDTKNEDGKIDKKMKRGKRKKGKKGKKGKKEKKEKGGKQKMKNTYNLIIISLSHNIQ